MTMHLVSERRGSSIELMPSNDESLLREVVRLNAVSTGIAFGILAGLSIFLATVWLVLKGGLQVGPHLMLLANYFPGYSVTAVGSLIGFAYGFVAGFVAGSVIGWLYNSVLRLLGR